MKFLIVAPRFVSTVGEYYYFPLGLAYISSSLKNKRYDVECLNLNHYEEPVEQLLEEIIVSKNIDVICTGGLSAHYTKIRTILDTAKKLKPDIITIIGGGLVSSEPALMLEAMNASFGVIGEGEETIIELADTIINSKDPAKVKGIIFFTQDKKFISTLPRNYIEDLDSLPFPDYEGFEIVKYLDMQMSTDCFYLYPYDNPREFAIISSRSCPYSCTFCYHPLGKKYRQRTLDNFFAEVDYLTKIYNINILSVYDELFSTKFNKERIHKFCKRIKKYGLKWFIQLRVDGIDEETIQTLKDAGCHYLSYGLESASNTILRSMRKHITVSQIENALKITKNAKIGVQANFIFGDVAETEETANETLDWWLKNREYQIWLIPIETYPGTEIYHRSVEKGIIKDRVKFIEDGCPILNLTSMSDEKFKELCRKLIKYTLEYNMLAKVLHTQKAEINLCRGLLYTIKVECPHCYSVIEYKNIPSFSSRFPFIRLICRKCNQKFDIASSLLEKVRARINFILAKEKLNRLAVWGTGIHTIFLLSTTALAKANLVCFFDNDATKHGNHIDGVEVVPLNNYPENLKSTIDAIIISSNIYEEQIFKQISHLGEYGINIYKIYNS